MCSTNIKNMSIFNRNKRGKVTHNDLVQRKPEYKNFTEIFVPIPLVPF